MKKQYQAVTAAEAVKVIKSRNHIHWFITEYGAVNLYGRSLQERAKLIISVAHPWFQEMLDEAAFKRFGPHFHYLWNSIG